MKRKRYEYHIQSCGYCVFKDMNLVDKLGDQLDKPIYIIGQAVRIAKKTKEGAPDYELFGEPIYEPAPLAETGKQFFRYLAKERVAHRKMIDSMVSGCFFPSNL